MAKAEKVTGARKMKISISTLRKLEASSIADAIEEIASESDSIASGIIGPSFSCSGPGSGWQKNHDATDYAVRALDEGYGASSYIDSNDGREAMLNDAGDVEWSDESVVEIELPSVEEALDNREEYNALIKHAVHYGADEDEVEALKDKVANPYQISGSGGREYAATLEEAASIAEDWYDFIVDEGRLDELPDKDLDSSSLDALNTSIRAWEQEIAEKLGKKDWAGHGRYFVSAADAAGMDCSVTIRE